MLSKISLEYNTLKENNIRILLNDGTNNKSIKLSLYCIRNNWYVDIYDSTTPLLLGQVLNTWIDLFEIIKIHYKNFPNLLLTALPSNINGINKEFNKSVAGITQEIFIVGNSNE